MAVYYKFKSAKDYDSVMIDGHFISVGHLKEKIFESKHLGKGTDFDLLITNAQTNEEYLDEGMLIPKNTSVLIRRVPGRPRMPIVTAPITELEESKVENNSEDVQAVKTGFAGLDPSSVKYDEDFEWDEFGNDLYAIPETLPILSSNLVQDAPPTSKEDEDMKIKALIDTPTLDWQRQSSDGFGPGRGFGRGMGGRMMSGRGFGRGILDRKTPPQGYICHRCKVPGHFIQHCPTNGDPNFDIKRVKPPTGIPKSMLMATPDGSYALPSGAVAVLKPNEAAFEKEIEGMPSTRSVGDLPPELHCPLCKEVMKDAVLTSKCCFKSFCDKCIRDHFISKSMCVCGATNILADDLLPNKTVRETINRILESNNSSGENGGSVFQVQDMESRNPQAMAPSPTQSAASKGQHVPALLPEKEETSKIAETVEEGKEVNAPQNQEEARTKVPDVSEATHGSLNVKEQASPGRPPLADEEVQEKPVSGEAGKKKKKKKIRMPPNADMQWTGQDLAAENYMMPFGPSAFNPYWTGMQPGMDGFMPPYNGHMPYMGYGLGPMDVAFGGVMPQDPFGGPGFMMPYGGLPQRDLADLAMGFNVRPPPGPPVMSREEFEARKADLKRKREMEGRVDRESSKDQEYGREGRSSTGNVSAMKSKSKSIPPPSSSDQHRYYGRSSDRHSPNRRSRDPEDLRPSSKRKSSDRYEDMEDKQHRRDYHDDHRHSDHSHHPKSSTAKAFDDRHSRSELSTAKASPEPPIARPKPTTSTADKKQKASVFSRISFPGDDSTPPKKRKISSSSPDAPVSASLNHHRASASNGYHEEHRGPVSGSRKTAATAASAGAVDYDSSDDDRHFKRRPSKYTSSPPQATEWDDKEPRRSKGSREKVRGRDRAGYNKHK
ncbi:zinc finger CCCH domain-containing 18-like isoform X1 [Olea europaea subsp. europaea]|uniref:Zinc finger CCCH domain-containing 18-like isoform X1 n=1 Tax=Olea europaea subsp. europaea TaxID=158383 RepID=A0A8S0TKY6_OLEEU|nr:zinc finger CCCH domain-containing 18-like isoform X1 [Olea europaea subsp. europaea]